MARAPHSQAKFNSLEEIEGPSSGQLLCRGGLLKVYLKDLQNEPVLDHVTLTQLSQERDAAGSLAMSELMGSDFIAAKILATRSKSRRAGVGVTTTPCAANPDAQENGCEIQNNAEYIQSAFAALECNRHYLRRLTNRSISSEDRESITIQLSKSRTELQRSLRALAVHSNHVMQLKDELRCYALETELLRIRLELAKLAKEVETPNACTPDSILRKLYADTCAALTQARKESSESCIIVRSPEELHALRYICERYFVSQGANSDINQTKIRIRSVLALHSEIASISVELCRWRQHEPKGGLSWEWQAKEDALKQRLHELRSAASASLESSQSSTSDVEIVAMRWALRERIAVMGEEPAIALNRVQNTEEQLAQKARVVAEIVRGNLRLVVSVARRFQGRGVPLVELIQSGNEALPYAAERYDPSRGFQFSTYAVWWIKRALLREVAEHHREQNRSRHCEWDSDSSNSELEPSGIDRMPEGIDRQRELEEELDIKYVVAKVLARLPPLQQHLVRLRYGLTENRQELSVEQIAQQRQCTASAVHTALLRARKTMRELLGGSEAAAAFIGRQ
jgi:RNA polymerase sigma factor (sigma-70 family)